MEVFWSEIMTVFNAQMCMFRDLCSLFQGLHEMTLAEMQKWWFSLSLTFSLDEFPRPLPACDKLLKRSMAYSASQRSCKDIFAPCLMRHSRNLSSSSENFQVDVRVTHFFRIHLQFMSFHRTIVTGRDNAFSIADNPKFGETCRSRRLL